MSELKNSFHTELAIGILLQDEDTLENKLNLLTEIGLTATSNGTFAICEKLRNQLCDKEISPGREDILRDSKTHGHYYSDSGNEEVTEMDGEQ